MRELKFEEILKETGWHYGKLRRWLTIFYKAGKLTRHKEVRNMVWHIDVTQFMQDIEDMKVENEIERRKAIAEAHSEMEYKTDIQAFDEVIKMWSDRHNLGIDVQNKMWGNTKFYNVQGRMLDKKGNNLMTQWYREVSNASN